MTEKRIQFNNILQNQLPSYVKEEFPLVAEFLKQYYISQEFQGAPTDLIQNIDHYIKLNEIKDNSDSTTLKSDVSFLDETIAVESTIGFPDSYGLIQIDDEIITYLSKTEDSFLGCIRGFSGTSSYRTVGSPEELVFKSSDSVDHLSKITKSDGTEESNVVINLSSLFLKEFFNKIKYQITPGFENREFYEGLDKYFFLKQSKDFYSTRGTDLSFKILFKALYGEDVKVIRPQDYLIKPSDAQYNITNDLVVESISGDPYELLNSTLKQDEYGNIPKGYAQISNVEKIFSTSEKLFYKLSFDAGYNRDIRVDGALYGTFSVHPKTKLIGEIYSGSDTLTVDSTVGFPLKGELLVIYNDGTEGIITYTSKNINQFFGCKNIVKTILDQSDICLNVYAYGQSNIDSTKDIKVRITSVLNKVNIVDDTYYQETNNIGTIKTLGENPTDVISNNWFFNISKNFNVISIDLIDLSDYTYELETDVDHNFIVGDSIIIISNDGSVLESVVSNIISNKIFQIRGQGELNLNSLYTIKRKINKVDSQVYPFLTNEIADVQNVYKDKEKTLVASLSLPSYKIECIDKSIDFSGVFIEDTFIFNNIINHSFYTGDSIYYKPDSSSPLLEEGVYFVARVNSNGIVTNEGKTNKLKFAKSRDLLYNAIKNTSKNSKFIFYANETPISDGKIIDFDFYNQKQNLQKKLSSQKLLREITTPINDGYEYSTNPGIVGILINGVEILNYKSKDKIYYGPIEQIDIINPGQDCDVINPPVLEISDSIGIGATGYCSVKGSLQSIRIIDSGFDYVETPIINITGGNGSGAKAYPVMKLIDHQVLFNSESQSEIVDISNNTIGFTTYHKFRNYERVIYKTDNQKGIGGISTNSSYYVSVKDSYTISLHRSLDDSISGINTISLTSYGVGNHILKSYNKKSVIAAINIEDSGQNYENKKRTANPESINIYLNEIEIKDHDFKSGEIINYSNVGSAIGGLANNTNYYVTVVDTNRFKLSLVSVSTDNQDFYYQTKQYVGFTSIGSGTHIFNYPQISVEVIGRVGISSISGNTFEAKVQSIFRGEIQSVHLENGGVGYGSSEVINFNRTPLITLNSGTGASLVPIINDGKIVDVLINNSGQSYNAPPNLSIITNGKGRGAVLTPILENGQIKSINIIESGAGYEKNSTSILVNSAGQGAKLSTKIKTWTVNLFAKYFNLIKKDDGIVFYNPKSKYDLQFVHLYAPRQLRENVYSREFGGTTLYGSPDLLKDSSGKEILSQNHSPIIGWAYDGNPIYGPYGYSKKDGGLVTRMKSGYSEVISPNRPSQSTFPVGFFVEDYEYLNVNDESTLDENNGRFCITPDFPNGTYAYFATIEEEYSDSFNGYIKPKFPYLIGNTFKSAPNQFNFERSSNQDNIDLNETDWIRNTSPYNIYKDFNSYSYISFPNLLNQTFAVKNVSSGSIDNIGIVTGGVNYKVNDSIVFDSEGTRGFGLSSKISRIGGKSVNSISVATTSIYGVEIFPELSKKNSFTIQSNHPHNFLNFDKISISGLNTSSFLNDDFYVVGVSSNVFAISDPSGIGDVSATGIVTYFSVSGNIEYSNVRENDIFTIGSEKIKILNLDKKSSRIRVLRSVNGSVGSSHSYSDVLYENSRRLFINTKNFNAYTQKSNKEIYFNPVESLGIGTISGVGIGTLLNFSNPGVGITQIFIPTKTIYIPNHELETGDSLVYSSNGGTEISVSNNGSISNLLSNNSIVYVAKISNDLIGISTVKVGLGSTGVFVGIASTTNTISTLYFTGVGTNTYHSFKTNYSNLTGNVYKNVVTVSTAQTHGLTNEDTVFVNVNTGITTTVIVKYDNFNRRILINPKSFSSSGINTSENWIFIENHGFKTGDKVIYNSASPSIGLTNNKIYYIISFDKNKVKLSESYYNSISFVPEVVKIYSTSNGTLSPINPPIRAYKNSIINFDLSDSSLSYTNGSETYPAFDLNFYIDSNYTQIFDSSKNNDNFEVKKSGIVGIDNNAKVSISINKNIPQKLFYNLDKVYSGLTLPEEKEEIVIDSSVYSNNELQIVESEYNGEHQIISTGSSSFTYNVINVPEKDSYSSGISSIKYETNSLSAFGPITKIKIDSKGKNYYSLPNFSKVISNYGSGAILEASSNSIGKINKIKISDIGFNFPSDSTLRPNLSLPQILKVEPLNSFKSIGITSTGKGYNTVPKLVVLDGRSKNVLSEVDLRYSLGDTEVQILNNTYSLNNISPIIIPTQNTNGVGISSISFNYITKDVTVILNVGYSTESSFPFSVGDKVLIENISVGLNSDGKGYNSENYNYELFTLTSIDKNIGGEYGSVVYNMSNFLSASEFPGNCDLENSSGRIIPEKFFPIFNPILKPNVFIKNEKIKYFGDSMPIGFVQNWNNKIKLLTISSKENIDLGKTLEGVSSRTQGKISTVISPKSFSDTGAFSKVENGWITETGILNNEIQKIQDNFYYQNFSYSLKSKVSYDTWNDAVGSLNHTAGFKKFSDYQLESYSSSGIRTDTISNVDVSVDIDGFASLNCVYDYDLAKENALLINSNIVSDEITFSSRILTDYFESVGNRVLLIDDISGLFNNNERLSNYSIVYRFPLSEARSQKYITYIRDRRYTSQRQLMILSLLHDDTRGYINQYGRVETYYDLGSFDFSISGNEGLILFYPTKYKVNDYDVTTLTYNIKDTFSGVGTTSIGGIVNIETKTTSVFSPTTIIGISTNYTSSKVLVGISATNRKYQYDELNIVHDGANVESISYGQLTNHSLDSYSNTGLGTYYVYISGSNLNVNFIPNTGIAASVSTICISIANTFSTGIGTFNTDYIKFEANSTSIASSTSPISNVIGEYSDNYDGGYFIVQISDMTNNRHQLSEVVVVNDETNAYFTEYANLETHSGLGTIGVAKTTNKTQLLFTPISNINVQTKVCFNSLSNIIAP
jgi:hypothetical protein